MTADRLVKPLEVSTSTFHRRRTQYSRLKGPAMKRLPGLESENAVPKQVVQKRVHKNHARE